MSMKIIMDSVPVSTIEEFADTHGLDMEVKERGVHLVSMSWIGHEGRFYCHFVGSPEIKQDGFLKSVFGDGPTPESAIANYAKQISEQTLVFRAYCPDRKEIKCPRFLKHVTVTERTEEA
jgi:hypothetical protein